VFSPELQFIRAIPRAGGLSAAFTLRGGSYLLLADVPTPQHIGEPFHIMGRDGGLVSFGNETPLVAPGSPQPVRPPLWPTTDLQSFWSFLSFHLEHWSIQGRKLASIDIHGVPWFPEEKGDSRSFVPLGRGQTPPASGDATAGATATIVGIDSTGLLWIYGRYRSANGAARHELLELFDPKANNVALSQAIDQYMAMIPQTNLLWSVMEDSDGLVSYVIWRHEIVKP
jgi:hypothetical protein